MKKYIDLHNVFSIIKAEIKNKYKSILIWISLMSLIMLLYMAIYPSVKDMMQDEFASLPKELLSFFGSGTISMSNINSYFALVFKVLSLIVCGYAITFGCSILHDEEYRGTIEYLNSQSINRYEIILSKFIVVCINIFLIYFNMGFISCLTGIIIDKEVFNLLLIIKTIFISSISAYVFISIGLLIASLLRKHTGSMGISLGIFFGLYLIGYISSLNVKSLSFFKWFSPTEYISPTEIINNENVLLGYIISLIIIIISMISTNIIYSKKDL